ncbi:hypothetical protein, conserved [Babesia bigemina]|uniref:Uncharacterized protein n=1 Tax=Babesia bigemina TaxID=5866 RepID=A0A061DAT6_BABBI|nr:hypothetical protein, conserved [Babesia bigemina]CDR97107.1 hypothetical protein, conserved [Babesia bigemina]|eukprot:XP_012769293.1 hypothetical protein, conserved [Babesia bigemina]
MLCPYPNRVGPVHQPPRRSRPDRGSCITFSAGEWATPFGRTQRTGTDVNCRCCSVCRFRPTHAERNTAVSLYEGYFDCDRKFQHCKIAYDRLNEQWEVLWTEFGKLNGKPFPVKKFGVEASKAESIAFAEELDVRHTFMQRRLSEELKDNPEPPKSALFAEPGVTFDHTLHCWVALGRVRGRPAARAFSADYHGYEGALKRASDFRTG